MTKMKKKKFTSAQLEWIAARRRFRLSDAQVQMARELGLNPRTLGEVGNQDQRPSNAPLPLCIEAMYEERFGRSMPEVVRSIEEVARRAEEKRAERKAKKRSEARELRADRALVEAPVRVEVPLPPGMEALPEGEAVTHRISDALVDVMAPFVAPKPSPKDLKPFTIMLELTVAVWNCTLAHDVEAELDGLADSQSIGRLSREEVRAFVGELAARKRERYPTDVRLVTEARVRADGEQFLVTAVGIQRR